MNVTNHNYAGMPGNIGYDPSALRGLLGGKGLTPEEVEQALLEIASGDTSSLKRFALEQPGRQAGVGELPPPRAAWTADDLNVAVDKVQNFDIVKVLAVLADAAQQLRMANRASRHAEREAAMLEAKTAADKIRSHALVSAILSGIGAAANICMGAVSLGMSVKSAFKTSSSDMSRARGQMKSAAADTGLAKGQMGLAKTRANADVATKTRERIEAKFNAESKVNGVNSEIAANNKALSDPNLAAQKKAQLQKDAAKLKVEAEARQAELTSLKSQQKAGLEADVKASETKVAKAREAHAKAVAEQDAQAETVKTREARVKDAEASLKVKQEAARNAPEGAERTKAEGEVEAQEKRLDQLKQEHAEADAELGRKTETAELRKHDLAAAETEHAANRKALNNLDAPTTEAEVARARDNEAAAKQDVEMHESKVKRLAAEAEYANDECASDLKRSIKSNEKQIAKLKDSANPADQGKRLTLENETAGMKSELAMREAKSVMYKEPATSEAIQGAEERYRHAAAESDPSSPLGRRYADAQVEFNRVNSEMGMTNATIQALHAGGGGLSQGLGAFAAHQNSLGQAASTEHMGQAQQAQTRESEDADREKAAHDIVQNALTTLKEYLQGQNQANSSIYRNM